MSDADEFVAEFLEECDENLDLLEQELVALESAPADEQRLQSIFRTIHTIKGSSGFFGFSKLGSLTHDAETLLGLVRDGKLPFTPEIASALLKMNDAVRELMSQIEVAGVEGDGDYKAIQDELQGLALQQVESVEVSQHSQAKPSTDESTPPLISKHAESESENLPKSDHENVEVVPPDSVENEDEVEEPSPSFEKTAKNKTENVSIRVDVGLLDELMDLASELVLARNELNQSPQVANSHDLSMLTNQLSLVTSAIQDRVMRTRMQPIDGVFTKFKRVVRDLAVQCDKQVKLELEGGDTELDRTLLEAIRGPLTHIVRNAIDHGIEESSKRVEAGKSAQGTLLLRASHQSGQVVIEAIDDGGGISVEAIRQKAIAKGLVSARKAAKLTDGQMLQYVFVPGFSTADQISEISGRGVGMDVVKTEIERIGGSVSLMSQLGVGTTLKITIPLTLAIVPALMVRTAGQRFVVPQASLLEVILVDVIETAQHVPVYRLRDRLLPLVWLDETLGLAANQFGTSPSFTCEGMHVVVLQAEDQRFGLVVDEVMNAQEVVVKPIGGFVKSIGAYSAATLLGDGTAALILDVAGIARLNGLIGHAGERGEKQIDFEEPDVSDNLAAEIHHQWLVCAVGEEREVAIPLETVERLDEIRPDQLSESATGMVANYQGGVLPLVALSSSDFSDAETIPIVIHRQNQALVGAVVERVVDVVNRTDAVTVREAETNASIVGMTTAGGRVMDVVDLSRVCR